MTRPSQATINNGENGWDADANDNFTQLYGRPAPIGERHAGTLASLDSARAPGSYEDSLAWAWFGASAGSLFVPVLNDGTNWLPMSHWMSRMRLTPITNTYTQLASDDVIIVTGSNTFDLTLLTPGVANEGVQIEVHNNGTGTVTLKGTIDGATDLVMSTQYESVVLRSDGSAGWLTVGGSGGGGGGGGATAFTGLTDTPANFTGAGSRFVKVNAGETALEFVAAVVGTFTGLSDTPANYTSAAGKVLKVNSGGTAVEFVNDGIQPIIVAVGDETTALTTGTAKITFRAPEAFTLTSVRASLTTVSTSGVVTVDINEAGSTVLSTKLTIDANELTSVTAATAAVISDGAIADDAEITIDIDTAGTGAAGLKVTLYGQRN